MAFKVTALLMFLLFLLWGFAYLWSPYQWQSQHQWFIQQLPSDNTSVNDTPFDPDELNDLPEPVQRYFNTVLKPQQSRVTRVHINHQGEFNMSETTENWRSFQSQQWVSTQQPGFLWDARMDLLPTLTVFVRDGYLAGKGILTAKLWGSITVMNAKPTRELAEGELMRCVAEAAWYPTALLPSQGVKWQAINAHQAQATLKDRNRKISLIFSFNENNLIETVSASHRYREVNGKQIATPWQGRFWDYQWRNGMLIPLSGEVAWLLPDGSQPYWRGQITSITHQFSN